MSCVKFVLFKQIMYQIRLKERLFGSTRLDLAWGEMEGIERQNNEGGCACACEIKFSVLFRQNHALFPFLIISHYYYFSKVSTFFPTFHLSQNLIYINIYYRIFLIFLLIKCAGCCQVYLPILFYISLFNFKILVHIYCHSSPLITIL